MFKNLTVYRIAPGFQPDLSALEAALAKVRFTPCGLTQEESSGWVEPRGVAHAPLVESIAGQWLMKLRLEQRLLPGSVLREQLDEMAAKVEEETGRKPGKKMMKELRDQALLDLLPRAFTRTSTVQVWLAPQEGWLVVDSGSQSRANDVVALLVEAQPGMGVSHLNTQASPAAAMSEWLLSGEAPAGFTVDRECELKSADEMKSVVRYARHPLDTDEVRQHITQGKVPTRLALTWGERVSFVLTESLQVKKLAFLDTVFENQGPPKGKDDDTFDADAALSTGELLRLLPDLVEALGGEQSLFESAQTADPVPASRPSQGHGAPAAAPPAVGHHTPLDDAPPW